MSVNIAVTGDNRGAIVVGDNNTVVINQAAGAVVLPAQPVLTRRRSDEGGLAPRAFPDIVDRADESAKLQTALAAVPPVPGDVVGPPGIGKTALLRHVCGSSESQAPFRDGAIYVDAKGQSADDLLQQLFEVFFESDRPFKPDRTQVRRLLARVSALVVLDGFTGDSTELERLLNLAATQTFVVSSARPALLGQGCSFELPGLTSDDAVTLIGREMGKAPEGREVMAARVIAAAFDGNPLDLLVVSAHARTYGTPLSQLAEGVRGAESPDAWLQQLVTSKLSERDRRALAAFASVDCAPLDASEVQAISGEPAQTVLDSLVDRRLVTFDGKRYRVGAGIVAGIVMALLAMLPAEAAAQAFLHATGMPESQTLVAHSDAVIGAMKQAALAGKHAEVIALARHGGDAVALGGQWDRWQVMLQHALTSSRASHQPANEAWALHQLGSRALAGGEFATAQTFLDAALKLRTDLGDPASISVTEANLTRLRQLIIAPPPQPSKAPVAARRGARSKVLLGLVLAAATASLGTWVAAKSGFLTKIEHAPRVASATRAPQRTPAPTARPTAPAAASRTPRPTPAHHHASPKPVATPEHVARLPSEAPPAVPTHAPSRTGTNGHPIEIVRGNEGLPPSLPTPLPPTIVTFAYRGEAANCLAYRVEHATRAMVSELGYVNLPSGCISVRRERETARYTIVAYGDRMTRSRTTTVPPYRSATATPSSAPPPSIVYLSYQSGETPCLAYRVINAKRATLAPLGLAAISLPSGCAPVRQERRAITYTLVAYGDGQASRSVTVPRTQPVDGTGSPPVIVDFNYRPGDRPCLYYEVRYAREANITPLGSPLALPSGCAPVRLQARPVTYTLVVVGAAGRASSVTVVPARATVYETPTPNYYQTVPRANSSYPPRPYEQQQGPSYRRPVPTGSPTRSPYATPTPLRRLYETPPPYTSLKR